MSVKTHDFSSEILINSASDQVDLTDTLTNWSSHFPIPVQLDPNVAYSLYVSSASITNTIDQFHKTELQFKLNNTVITIDPDIVHQNTSRLCVYLSNLCATNNEDLLFTLDPTTHRIKIKNTSGADLTLDLSSQYLPFWQKLGFRYDTLESLSQLVLSDQQEVLLKYICRRIPTERCYITCDQIKNNSYYPTNNNKAILASIDIVGGYGTYNTYTAPFIYEHDLIYSNTFQYLSFQVLDDQFRPIELRGGGVNLSLVVRKTNFSD